MRVIEHNITGWSRFAQAAYAAGHNATGHRFSVAATRANIPAATFDSLMRDYRAWLCFNEFPETTNA